MSNKIHAGVENILENLMNKMESVEKWNHFLKEGFSNGFPKNFAKRPYNGINAFWLALQGIEKNYNSSFWGTFKSISEAGGKVKKGEKSTIVTFYTLADIIDKESGENKKIPLLKTYLVFNACQCEGLPESFYNTSKDSDSFENNFKINLGELKSKVFHEATTKAYYTPLTDKITMPLKHMFKSESSYFSTLFHELSHLTGHESRLNRTFGKFGDSAYAIEELIAELSATILCVQYNVSNEYEQENSAAYLKGWLKVAKVNPKSLIKFFSMASKAAEYIIERISVENAIEKAA